MVGKHSFKQQLLEAIKFVAGKDDDYFYRKYGLITVTKDGSSQYKLTPGKRTAGLEGHAVKHLIEIDREYVSKIFYNVKKTLIEHIKNNDKEAVIAVYKDGRRRPLKPEDDKQLIDSIKKAPFFSIANTLDMINDKLQEGVSLSPLEQQLTKYLDNLGDRYGLYIEQAIKKAVDIDKIKDQQQIEDLLVGDGVVTFKGEFFKFKDSERGHNQQVYLDLDKQVIMFTDTRGVHSAFRIGTDLQDRTDPGKMSKAAFIAEYKHKYEDRVRYFEQRTMRAIDEVGEKGKQK